MVVLFIVLPHSGQNNKKCVIPGNKKSPGPLFGSGQGSLFV
jgi:hypothetical protein